MSFLAGFAQRGSEYIQSRRKEQARNNEIIVQGVLDAMPELKERKSKRREMRNLAKTFKNTYNLSDDQIGSILRSGTATETLAQMRKLDTLSPDLRQKIGYDPSNVVKFHEGYEQSGLTLDQHLDAVLGKLNTGMNLSDALQDVTGKPATGFASLLEPKNKMAAGRLAALETAYGKDTLSKALAVRQDNITYGDDFTAGAVRLPDPITQSAVRKSLEGKTTGMTNVETTRDALFDFGADLVGGKEQITSSGIIYSFEQPGRRVELKQKIASLVSEKEKEVGRSTFNADERTDIQNKLYEWAIANEYYTPPAQQAEAEVTAAASALDTIKADMRTNTSWMERGQGRQELVQKLATALVEAGLATDDTAISEAFTIVFDTEKQIKEAQAAAAAANKGSNQDVNSDFAGGA